MGWIRQHSERGRVCVVARVFIEGSEYVVRLVEMRAANPLEPGCPVDHQGNQYHSRDMAFAACSTTCSGWAEDAEIQ